MSRGGNSYVLNILSCIRSSSACASSYNCLPLNSIPPGSLTPWNLIKFQGVKLPGGIEFNGRQIYDDAQAELDKIEEKMMSTYEIPPLDLIG